MYENAADMPKSTNESERKRNIEAATKQSVNNPCVQEQKLSYKCLSDHNYDQEACSHVFANYKACREFWTKVQADRRAKGIRPILPRPEDRETIKAEYMKKLHS